MENLPGDHRALCPSVTHRAQRNQKLSQWRGGRQPSLGRGRPPRYPSVLGCHWGRGMGLWMVWLEVDYPVVLDPEFLLSAGELQVLGSEPQEPGIGVDCFLPLDGYAPEGASDRGMYFILRLTQLIVRPDSRLGVLRYKIVPKCLLPGPFGHSGVGGNPGVAGTVRSYNLVFTYPCQGRCLDGNRRLGRP